MSAQPHAAAAHHDHGHAHDDVEDGAHGSLKGYVAGFLLSVVLTAIPFWLVGGDVLGSSRLTAFAVMGFAVVQIVVHMIFFLHMNTHSEAGWNMLALVFTAVLVVIMLAGSLWVMYHLNTNMMPGMHDMRQMP